MLRLRTNTAQHLRIMRASNGTREDKTAQSRQASPRPDRRGGARHEWGNSCTDVLQLVSATRGALNGVMSEVVHRSLLSEITARTGQRLAITNWSLTMPRRDVHTVRKGMFDKEKDDDIR
jgi:hypothetical protein